jgi:hypothetical protein
MRRGSTPVFHHFRVVFVVVCSFGNFAVSFAFLRVLSQFARYLSFADRVLAAYM